MSQFPTPTPAAGVRRFAMILVAGLSLGLPLAGCDQENASSQAISKATLDLQSLVPGGVQPASAAYRSQVYSKIVSDLKTVADKGTKSQTAAAYLLMSQAQTGLADGPAQEAALLEHRSLNQIMEIQAELGQWFSHNAMADAAASYDPTKELADIDALIKDRETQRITAQNQKSKVDADVAKLLAEAKAKNDQAKAKQQEAGTLRSQAMNQSAVQGEQTLKRAQAIGREADALEVESATLDARAAQIAPQSGAIQLEIDRLSNQKELLEKARADVNTRAQTARTNAGNSRAEATKAAESIKSKVAALESFRSGDLEPKLTEAVNGYAAAAASASKAIGDSRSSAQMAVGSAQQSLGDVHWTRAHGLNTYAQLMETLAAAKPALPDSAAYANKAAEARTAAKAALDAATEAYSAADAAYQASGNPQARERIERLRKMLGDAVFITSNGSKDIRAAATDTGDSSGSASGEAAPAAEGSAAAAFEGLLSAFKAGQMSTVVDSVHVSDPSNRQILTSIASTLDKAIAFDGAVKAKFGRGFMELAGGQMAGMMPGAMPNMADLQSVSMSDFRVEEDGDTASVYHKDDPDPTKLVKVDGRWKFDLTEQEQQLKDQPQGAQYKQLIAFALPLVGKALDELKTEVEANAYPSAEMLMTGIQVKVGGLMQALAPKMQELGIDMGGFGPGGG